MSFFPGAAHNFTAAIDFAVVYSRPLPDAPKRKKNTPVSHRGKVSDPLQPKIRFGLGGVKGVGGSALEAIFEARSGMLPGEPPPERPKNEPFVDLFDLFCRIRAPFPIVARLEGDQPREDRGDHVSLRGGHSERGIEHLHVGEDAIAEHLPRLRRCAS